MIDNSLAKGLTSQYFREAQSRYEIFHNDILQHNIFVIKKSKWLSTMKRIEEKYPDFIISSYFSNSKSHPYFSYCYIGFGGRNFEQWTEKSFHIAVEKLGFKHEDSELGSINHTQVSHHAIQRLIQRRNDDWFNSGSFSVKNITSQLANIANWGGIYVLLFLNRDDPSPITEYWPKIPNVDGVFLCKRTNTTVNGVSVRTFVATEQLARRQKQVRDTLLNAYRGMDNVPFFSFLNNDTTLRTTLEICMAVFVRRLGQEITVICQDLATDTTGYCNLSLAERLRHRMERLQSVYHDIALEIDNQTKDDLKISSIFPELAAIVRQKFKELQ